MHLVYEDSLLRCCESLHVFKLSNWLRSAVNVADNHCVSMLKIHNWSLVKDGLNGLKGRMGMSRKSFQLI